ncbi:uncharacterized protein At4g15970-like [Nymphaea colorata]|nr:uncharacterized protein At4g15970-like [Nymphaea colorata]XP_031484489.1 uncharacterized protein At4g15970-like [Nymphaea colorata]
MKVPGMGQKYVIKETHIVLLWVAVVLLAFASVMGRDVYGLSKLSSMSAKLFSLPNAKSHLVAQSNVTAVGIPASLTEDPQSKSSLLDEHHNASVKNPIERIPTPQSPSAELPMNASEEDEFEESFSDNDVTAANGSASSPQSPATESAKAPQNFEKSFLIGTNISANSNILSTPEQKPRIMNNDTEPLHDSPPQEAERSSVTTTNLRDSAISPTNRTKEGTPALDELDYVLAETADENKTVIVITLNSAWAQNRSMIDLFLESFRVGEGTKKLLDHLLIVAVDAKAYDRCVKVHPHCYILRTQGVDFSAEKKYMTQDYLKMMWRRLGFLGDILNKGYNFLFSDTDIMWLRNPFQILSQDADIQIASDRFNGNATDIRNRPNCGFKFVRSNKKTVSFYQYWYRSRWLFPGKNEQEVINILKYRSSFKKWNMKFLFLNSKYFGGFCQRSQYIDETFTMHATCCKGLKAKLADLRTTLDEFIAAKQNVTVQQNSRIRRPKWSAPKACPLSWSTN